MKNTRTSIGVALSVHPSHADSNSPNGRRLTSKVARIKRVRKLAVYWLIIFFSDCVNSVVQAIHFPRYCPWLISYLVQDRSISSTTIMMFHFGLKWFNEVA